MSPIYSTLRLIIWPSANWLCNEPIFSARVTYGCTISAISGGNVGAFTAFLTPRPKSASVIWCAISIATFICASSVEAPRCGVTITLSNVSKSLSSGGSFSKTSRAQAAIIPDFKPLANAFSSTIPPRAQLISRTPFLINAISFSEIICFVSLVKGVCTVI